MDEQKELQTNSTPSQPIEPQILAGAQSVQTTQDDDLNASQIPVVDIRSLEMESVPTQTKTIPVGIPKDASVGMLNSQEVEVQKPNEIVPDIEIPTLRTYKSDINQTVSRDKISTAKILIAEQNRNKDKQTQNFETSIKRPTNILVLLVSIVLILAAVGGVGYVGYKKVVKPDIAPAVAPTTFLFVFDNQKFIDSSKDILQVQSALNSITSEVETFANKTYTDVIFYKTNPQTNENTRISSSEFFAKFEISIPTNIVRAIGKDFVYGLYTKEGKTEPFLVISIIDYETVYSSMFTWESTLALDINTLFPKLKDLFDVTKIRPQQSVQVATSTATTTTVASTTPSTSKATSTATTTPQLTPEQKYQQQLEAQNVINRNIRFLDVVFSNKDARAVRDENGTPFFYYSFIDKTKILFAQDPELLSEISRKIKEKNLVR